MVNRSGICRRARLLAARSSARSVEIPVFRAYNRLGLWRARLVQTPSGELQWSELLRMSGDSFECAVEVVDIAAALFVTLVLLFAGGYDTVLVFVGACSFPIRR